MAFEQSLEVYENPAIFWTLPEEEIQIAFMLLATETGQEIMAPLLLYGIYLKHPHALSRAENGGRKVAGIAMMRLMDNPAYRERLNAVLRYAHLGDTTACPRLGEPPPEPSSS